MLALPNDFRTLMACPHLFSLPLLDEITALNNFGNTNSFGMSAL